MKTRLIALTAAAILAGCDDSSPVGPGTQEGTLTVDASQGWAYVGFEDGEASLVTVTDPRTSSGWDIAFNATSVMLNGGAAGPGGVAGYCFCQNAFASNAEVMAMTPSSELADFESVHQPEPPQDAGWVFESFEAAVDEWYTYDFTTHTVGPAPQNVFAVRTASGDAFAKLRVIDIEGATQTNAGRVTFEYAYQPGAGEPFAVTDTVTLDASVGERLDLGTGSIAATGAWDLELEGWTIRLNGGVSGNGSAGAYLTGATFEEVVDAGEAPAGAFSRDTYAGVFAESPWYRYNLGGNHQIWPTFDVYLIDTADGVYKVQLTGYYSQTGDSRRITFRYAKLD